MKLTVLKILALLVMVAGIVALGYAFNRPQVEEPFGQILTFFTDDGAGFNPKLMILGAVLALIGAYGLIPQLRDKHRAIRYTTDHGEVNIEVRRAEATLREVISAMPEVKSVKVHVVPDKDKKRAIIHADAVVINQDNAPARQTFDMISELIEETATDVLGLEIKRPVQLKVTGTQLDAKAASQALHDRVAQRASTAPAWVGTGAVAGATTSALASSSHAEDTIPLTSTSTAYADLDQSAPVDYGADAEDDVTASKIGPGVLPTDPAVLSSFEEEPVAQEEDVHTLPTPQHTDLEPLELSGPITANDTEEHRNIFDSDRSLPPLTDEEELPAAEPVQEPNATPNLDTPEERDYR